MGGSKLEKIMGVVHRKLVDGEIAQTGLTELILAAEMQKREAKMAELAEAFAILIGGSGTTKEFFEQWTWAQISYYQNPIGLLTLSGNFAPLLPTLVEMVHSGFLSELHRDMLFHEPKSQRHERSSSSPATTNGASRSET